MGCCLGTAAVNHRPPPKPTASKSPPAPPFEEETVVKEVLSETPIVPKPQPPNIIINLDERKNENDVVELTKSNHEIINPEERKSENDVVESTKNITVEIQENMSELSEMYSYSESFSAATTATTMTTVADNKKDEIEVEDDDEVTQKVKTKSPPAKKVARKRPMVSSCEFPARKERGTRPMARRHVAPSPENKRQSPSRTTTNTTRNRNVASANDFRRSRSPAVRRDTCQRRKVRGNSPVAKSGDLLAVTAIESEGKSAVEKTGDGGVSPLPETEAEVPARETLENPLVSLECFIFL